MDKLRRTIPKPLEVLKYIIVGDKSLQDRYGDPKVGAVVLRGIQAWAYMKAFL